MQSGNLACLDKKKQNGEHDRWRHFHAFTRTSEFLVGLTQMSYRLNSDILTGFQPFLYLEQTRNLSGDLYTMFSI